MSGQIRYLEENVRQDLKKKMVFLGGPRQVGKTTLSLSIIGSSIETDPAYLSWDDKDDRKAILAGAFPSGRSIVVLDEIHKYRGWRNLIKGFHDKQKSRRSFLVTGSAKLDYYRRGGDSLQGRYFYYRLHPYSLFEMNPKPTLRDLEALLKFGGFPEPLFSQSEKEWKRWQRDRKTRVIREDILELEEVKQVSDLDLLVDLLPDRVGSPLSIMGLREDLSVAHETIERYVKILENLYVAFRISPYGAPKVKAVKKEQKCYLWDWSLCDSPGAKLENYLASNLLKYCHFLEDTEGDEMDLRFLKNKEKKEIDFVVLKNKKPIFAVECKSGNHSLSSNIKYYAERTSIPVFYQVHLGDKDYELSEHRARVLPLTRFCAEVLRV